MTTLTETPGRARRRLAKRMQIRMSPMTHSALLARTRQSDASLAECIRRALALYLETGDILDGGGHIELVQADGTRFRLALTW